MPSIDTLAAAIRLALENIRAASAGISSSREQTEELRDELSALGADNKAAQVGAIAATLEEQQARAASMASLAESALAAVESLRGNGGRQSGSPPAIATSSRPGAADTAGPSIARPSMAPDPNRKPMGPPELSNGKASKARSIELQNGAAALLSKLGYSVQQSQPPRGTKQPDFIIEGKWWDCYAPTSAIPKNVRKAMHKKVKDEQADRIILDLTDSELPPDALRQKLTQDPISGLKEIKIVRDGTVIDFYPWKKE